ncbi:hypothetical protein S40293_09876 [Stachybotrys chartarum IBT 40293]|nr:hypothetical protein S40293_09876 [Stachybotrys chartarum IBT 40293]
MSRRPSSYSGDYRPSRIARTNSGGLTPDPDLGRDERPRDRSRDRSRSRRYRAYLEEDEPDYYGSRYEYGEFVDVEREVIGRRRHLSVESGQVARDSDRFVQMPRSMLAVTGSSPPVVGPRRAARFSSPSMVEEYLRGPSLYHHNQALGRVEGMGQIYQESHRRPQSIESYPLSYYGSARSPYPLYPDQPSLVMPPPPRPVTRPNPMRSPPATPLIEVPPVIQDTEPSPESKMRTQLLDSLWCEPFELVHDHLSKLRPETSGEQILALPEVQAWRRAIAESPEDTERGGNCLWLQGGLGAGKTMNSIIRRLKSDLAKEPREGHIVIYYYFDRRGGCTPYQAVSSLLRQMCDQKDIPLPRFLAEMETEVSDIASGTGKGQFKVGIRLANLVSDFISAQCRFERVYICLDGLEECDNLLAFMSILCRVSAAPETRLALAARSRIVEQAIALGVGRKEMVMKLEDHNNPDIRNHLADFITCRQRTCLCDIIGTEALPGLLDKLVENSGGNFLSGVAQAAQLNRLTSLAEINSQLEKPPVRLAEVIDLVLSRFNDQSPQRSLLARRVLYWLSVARRPLSLRELQQAVAAEPGVRINDPSRLPPPSLITAVCMGFVHIDIENNKIFTTPSALPFYLYQFNSEFASQAREYAAVSCLALIRSDTLFLGPFTSQTEYDDMEQKLPFANYASQNWGIHLTEAGDEESMNEILENDSLLKVLSQILHFSSQTESMSPAAYDNCPTGFGVHHFRAYFGLAPVSSKRSTQEHWATARDSWNRSPLHVCFRSPGLYERHVLFDLLEGESFVALILESAPSKSETKPEDQGSENNEQAKSFRYEAVRGLPWKWGSEYGQDSKITTNSVLLQYLNDAYTLSEDEMKMSDKDGKTPLHYFIAEWSDDIMLGFLQMMDGDTVLGSGADDGKESDNGSDSTPDSWQAKFFPLASDNRDRTMLDYACERSALVGSIAFEITEWSPKQMNSGIAIASSCGYVGLVNWLCEMIDDAPISNDGDFELGQAVIEASKRGFTDIVRLLRQRGAALTVRSDDGMSPLHHAAYGCHEDMVRFLLLEGADPNQLDNFGRSPLFCGCESGSDAIVALLREKGASVTRANSKGQILLHLAASRGNVDVVRRLISLDSGAVQLRMLDPGAGGLALQSPLHIAARQGHHAVVKLLLEEGFPMDARDGDGRTPLSYACEGGYLESVQILLSKKRLAAANSKDKNQRTPLSYAAAGGHVDVVAALVGQTGVDPNIKDVEGKTALIHAAQRGHHDTVVVLILLASSSRPVGTAVMRSFKELYARFSSKPTGNIAVDVDVKDNEGHSAVFYLKKNGCLVALDVARYIVEVGQKPKAKALVDGDEAQPVEADGEGNKPEEIPERSMTDDQEDQESRQQQTEAVETTTKTEQVSKDAKQETGDGDTQKGVDNEPGDNAELKQPED